MDAYMKIDAIDSATFRATLAEYPTYLPRSIKDQDYDRIVTIPAALHARDPLHLTKDELERLMNWKLAYGKFRFQLQRLIAANEAVTVKSVTIEAYRLPLESLDGVKKALSALSTLSGVGPATASLLLMVKDQQNHPFFSDELCRWACWKDGEGWKQEIKYSEKAYLEMYPHVQALRGRLASESGGEKVSALDVEKVAYVLGRQAAGVKPGPNGAVDAAVKTRKRKAKEADGVDRAGSALDGKIPGRRKVKEPKVESAEGAAAAEPASYGKARNGGKASGKTKTGGKLKKSAADVVKADDAIAAANKHAHPIKSETKGANAPAYAAASGVGEEMPVEELGWGG